MVCRCAARHADGSPMFNGKGHSDTGTNVWKRENDAYRWAISVPGHGPCGTATPAARSDGLAEESQASDFRNHATNHGTRPNRAFFFDLSPIDDEPQTIPAEPGTARSLRRLRRRWRAERWATCSIGGSFRGPEIHRSGRRKYGGGRRVETGSDCPAYNAFLDADVLSLRRWPTRRSTGINPCRSIRWRFPGRPRNGMNRRVSRRNGTSPFTWATGIPPRGCTRCCPASGTIPNAEACRWGGPSIRTFPPVSPRRSGTPATRTERLVRFGRLRPGI